VEEALNYLLYVPIQLSIGTDQSALELGASISEVTLSWTVNKVIVSQSIDGGIGSLAPGLRTYQQTFAAPGLSTNTNWTITVNDGINTATASTGVSFMPKAYWGVSLNPTVATSDILAFPSSAIATARARSMTYNCTGGVYPYYCYPASFGAITSVLVGTFAYSDYVTITQSLTNAEGFTQDYLVTRFNNIQNGAAIGVSWS
jgi:hypothetical protein